MKNTKILGLTLAIIAAMGSISAEYVPEEWNHRARKQFADQRFGIFIHWGLYANYAQGEWYLEEGPNHEGGIDEAAYSRMIDGFCPSKFDAKEWVKVFKRAGAQYVTITSRHHDGFSLWPTKADDGYNIANTPFKRDILGELAAACKEAGLQLNFYYSLMDWHRADYLTGHCYKARKTLPPHKEDYPSYKRFMMAQITELLDNYHPGNIWFDGEWDHLPHETWDNMVPLDWELDDIYDLIHSRHALVANNNHINMRPKEDIQLFERDLPGENETGFSQNQAIVQDRPIEQCDVIQTGVWGYKIAENNFRTPEEVVAMVVKAAAKNSNLLMNIGPDGSGRLPAQAVKVMEKVGGWFETNGESVYGTQAGGVALQKSVVSTRKDKVLYLHFLDPTVSKLAFELKGRIKSAKCLEKNASVRIERTDRGDAVVTVDRPRGYGFDLVVKLEIEDKPSCRIDRICGIMSAMNIDELNRQFGAPGRIVFHEGLAGYPNVTIVNKYGAAEIALLGANVLSYRPTGQSEVLFKPAKDAATYNRSEMVHAGIPTCWPKFGSKFEPELPPHGFARYLVFEVRGSEYSDEMTELTLGLKSNDDTRKLWPHDFDLEYKVSVSMKLNLSLKTKNTGSEDLAFSCGFHPYFRVRNRNEVEVRGIKGTECIATINGEKWMGLRNEDFKATIASDDVFKLPSAPRHEAAILDPGLKRAIGIAMSGADRLVVWNSGDEAIPDHAADDWSKFICVEPVSDWPEGRVLKPGETHTLTAAFQATLEQK